MQPMCHVSKLKWGDIMLEKILLKLKEFTCVHFIEDFIIDKDGNVVCQCKKCGKRIYYDNDTYEYHRILHTGHEDFWED